MGIMRANQEDIVKMEKEVINMIDNNIERYLKANPHSDLGNYSYSDKLTKKLFYNVLYFSDQKAEEAEKELEQWFNMGNNVAIILGYMGCGKTTFVNYYLWKKEKINKEVILFDFEKMNVDAAGDIVANKLGMHLYVCLKDKEKNYKDVLYKLYDDNYDFFDTCEKDNCLDEFMNYYCSAQGVNKRTENAIIKNKLLNMRIESLFNILGLVILGNQSWKNCGRDHIICFDNLDVAYEGKSLEIFYAGFLNFITNWERGLPKFKYAVESIGKCELYKNMKFVFCMRETSKAKVTAYFKKEITGFVRPINLTEVYDKAAIIKKRVDLLKKYNYKVGENILKRGENIEKILDDSYNKLNIIPLFNHDYRSCINNIVMICCNPKNFRMVENYLQLNSSKLEFLEIQYGKYGARGILFRLIFNVFKEEQYYDKISLFNFESITHKEQFSIPRMILTYVSNIQTNSGRVGLSIGGSNTPVALNRIFDAFQGIIDADIIVNCIITMYELRETSWNHLITFDTLRGDSVEHIRIELQNYKENKKSIEYSTVLVTCGGNVYLSTMATHFEFFASRIWGSDSEPLFSKKNFVQDEDGNFPFEQIIEKVYENVKNCCNRIRKFDIEKLLPKFQGNNIYANYADSEYVYKDRKEKDGEVKIIKQFHGEKIIHTHIGYIDAFRMYLLNSNEIEEDLKPRVNEKLIEFIKKYIEIIDQKKVIFSDTTIRIVTSYQKAIEKIEGSKYRDRQTAVSVEAGLNL